MKNILLSLFILISPFGLRAQFKNRPVIEIMTNLTACQDQQPNLCVQILATPRIGLCLSGNLSLQVGSYGSFMAQSRQWTYHGEMRIFLFGSPNPHKIKSTLRPFEKRKRGYGCISKKNILKKTTIAIRDGIFIAPGYEHQSQHLQLSSLPDIKSPIKEFKYNVLSAGGTLAVGCQMRFWRLSVSAGWGLSVTKPRWTGPADIFGDSLYTTVYPWKLNIQYAPHFQLGFNF